VLQLRDRVRFADVASRGTLNAVNFFSYFTIQSNLIAIAALVLPAVAMLVARGTEPRRFDMLRGGAVVYMTVTGVVYGLLLSGTDVDTALSWVNDVVHRLMPIVIVIDWLLDPPPVRIELRRSLVWVVYPVAWIAYTMVRGALVTWYPYPFLDPAPNGYGPVIVTILVILAAGIGLCLLVAWVGNALGARRRDESAAGAR
jgi:hypothetical protein